MVLAVFFAPWIEKSLTPWSDPKKLDGLNIIVKSKEFGIAPGSFLLTWIWFFYCYNSLYIHLKPSWRLRAIQTLRHIEVQISWFQRSSPPSHCLGSSLYVTCFAQCDAPQAMELEMRNEKLGINPNFRSYWNHGVHVWPHAAKRWCYCSQGARNYQSPVGIRIPLFKNYKLREFN